MQGPTPNQINDFDYFQDRKKELEELLQKERGLRHIIEIQIAQQGGDDFAQPGLISQRESHNKKIDGLKKELDKINEKLNPKPSVYRKQHPKDELIIVPFDNENIEEVTRKPFGKKVVLLCIFLLSIAINIAIWKSKIFLIDTEQNIVIDTDFHHLGDNLYNEEYMQSITGDRIRNLTPEGITYTKTFVLPLREQKSLQSSNVEVKIYITINHLKPRKSSPVTIFLNGHFIAYLNDFVTQEQFKREQVSVPIDPEVLIEGINEVFIQVDQDTVEGDYEDMEFNNLGILIIQLGGQANAWAFAIIGFVEIVILIVLAFLPILKP